MIRHIRTLIGALVLLLCASPAFAQTSAPTKAPVAAKASKGLLDGKTFTGTTGEQGKDKGTADNLVFVEFTRETIDALAHALNDPDSDVRLSAGVTLFIANTAARNIVPQLINALDHSDVRVCRLAAACLSNLGADAQAAVPRLQQLGEAADGQLRSWVAEAIGEIECDA